jgi:hypothetical protein
MEKISYTIIAEGTTPASETALFLKYNDRKPAHTVELELGNTKLTVSVQQLMELGALFLAVAGPHVDFDSADELLEGFRLKGKAVVEKLAETLS